MTLIQALFGICSPIFFSFHISYKSFHSEISCCTLTHIKLPGQILPSSWYMVPSLCLKSLNISQYLDDFFLQSPLGRAELHPQAQRDKLLLSHLRLVLMQQKDPGPHRSTSSSSPNPCRVHSLISEHVKLSPTKDRSLKARRSVFYAKKLH